MPMLWSRVQSERHTHDCTVVDVQRGVTSEIAEYMQLWSVHTTFKPYTLQSFTL